MFKSRRIKREFGIALSEKNKYQPAKSIKDRVKFTSLSAYKQQRKRGNKLHIFIILVLISMGVIYYLNSPNLSEDPSSIEINIESLKK